MASKFRELFLNTYNATGTLDGVEVHSTVKTRDISEAVTAVEVESPGFNWVGMHQVKHAINPIGFSALIFATVAIVLSLLHVVATSTFDGVLIVPSIILGFYNILSLRDNDKTFNSLAPACLFLAVVFIAFTLVGLLAIGSAPLSLILPIILGSFLTFCLHYKFSGLASRSSR